MGRDTLNHDDPDHLLLAYVEADGVMTQAAERFEADYFTVRQRLIGCGIHEVGQSGRSGDVTPEMRERLTERGLLDDGGASTTEPEPDQDGGGPGAEPETGELAESPGRPAFGYADLGIDVDDPWQTVVDQEEGGGVRIVDRETCSRCGVPVDTAGLCEECSHRGREDVV